MGNGNLWLPTESEPLNRLQKIVTVDYVRKTTGCANFDANSSTGASGRMGEIYRYFFTYIHTNIYLFLWDQPAGQTLKPMLTRNVSIDAKSHKDVPFVVTKIKIYI